jgi:hypothetical protein
MSDVMYVNKKYYLYGMLSNECLTKDILKMFGYKSILTTSYGTCCLAETLHRGALSPHLPFFAEKTKQKWEALTRVYVAASSWSTRKQQAMIKKLSCALMRCSLGSV